MRVLLLVLAILAGICFWSRSERAFLGSGRGADFMAFYAAGNLITVGEGAKIYDATTISRVEQTSFPRPYLNPPFFAGFISPITRLPYTTAYRAVVLLNLTLLVVIVWRVWVSLPETFTSIRGALVIGICSLYPITSVLEAGQTSLLLMASWLLAFAVLRRGREGWAGLAFSPALIKPALGLPIALFLGIKGHPRFAASFGLAATLLCLMSVAIVGPAAAMRYPSYLMGIASRDGYGTTRRRSLAGTACWPPRWAVAKPAS